MPQKKILLVDDNKGQRLTLEGILKKSGFDVISADCGTSALNIADKESFAAALLDIKMPDITGIDVLREIKAKKPDTTVIMMTGYSETEFAIAALNAGASAYLMKPANIEQLKILLNQAIEHQRLLEENKAMAAALREFNTHLEDKIKKRTDQLMEAYQVTLGFYEELKKVFESTLEILSIAIDQRDHLTSAHSFRVTQYAIEIGQIMGLSKTDIEQLRYAGLMHDLGKIEVPTDILTKEGSLTSEEYREIQTHARGTFDLLSRFDFKNELTDVPIIASSHHERYDGKGYPKGLKGEEIHLLARLLAVSDVLDAITSRRHYRTAMMINDALGLFKREEGGHFDPDIVKHLFKVKVSDFIKIHMAEFLAKVDPKDLIEMSGHTLHDLYEASKNPTPSIDQVDLVQLVYKYYQGPVPGHLEGKVQPAPRITRD